MLTDYVHTPFLKSTLAISTETGQVGTGFVVDLEGNQILVTANHVVPQSAQVTLRLTSPDDPGANILTLKRLDDLLDVDEFDLAIFELHGSFSTISIDCLSITDISIAQPLFILGYPSGNRFSIPTNEGVLRTPFIRHGILSGVTSSGTGQQLFADSRSNPGMSGGPVAFINHTNKLPQIAGMVVQSVFAGEESQDFSVITPADEIVKKIYKSLEIN